MVQRIEVKTIVLQEMAKTAEKGAGNIKMIPMTELIQLRKTGDKLSMMTTDITNYLYVSTSNVTGDDFSVALPVGIFTKLVAKTTSANIKLELQESSLIFIGNGKYTFELYMEYDKPIELPDPLSGMKKGEVVKKIAKEDIKTILSANKVSLANTFEAQAFFGYYLGERAITTNGIQVSVSEIGMLKSPALISSEMMNLIGQITVDEIAVYKDGNKFLFDGANIQVYGVEMPCLEDFPIGPVSNYISAEFPSYCKIGRSQVLEMLDRMALFVSPYDKNQINFLFGEKGIMVESNNKTGGEDIPYSDAQNYKPYTCAVNIHLFKEHLLAIDDEVIELHFGHDRAIKLKAGKITQILALIGG